MVIDGTNYSDELVEKIKELYLTVPSYGKYPVLSEFGITRREANKIIDKVLPKVELTSIGDIWDVYRKYPDVLSFGRIIRDKAVITNILDNVVTFEVLNDMFTNDNMLIEDIIKELNLPPIVTVVGVNKYLYKRGIKRGLEKANENRNKIREEWQKDPKRAKEAKEKRIKTNIERYGVADALQNKEILEKAKKTNLERYGVPFTTMDKVTREKMQQTSLSNYGVDNPLKSKEVQDKVRKTNLKKYGVENPFGNKEVRAKIKKTFLRKYGVPHNMQAIEVREKAKATNLERYGSETSLLNKEVQEKIRETNIRKYGVPNPLASPEVREKARKTHLEKYGVEFPYKRNEIREKIKKTNLEKYGVENPLRNKEVQRKIKETLLRKYGVEHPYQNLDIKEKGTTTILSKYGVRNANQISIEFTETSYVHTFKESIDITESATTLKDFLYSTFPGKKKFTMHEISRIIGRRYNFIASKFSTSLDFIEPSKQGRLPETMQRLLESLGFVKGVDFITNDRTAIKPQEIDFYFPKKKVGIEVNDLWTHNSTSAPYNVDPKPKNYHMEKSKIAKEKGIRLIHAWEHYFDNPDQYEVLKNAIKHALGISKYRVYARNTYVKEVPNITLKEFFNKNNIQGFRGAKTAYALFDKKTDEVLMAYSVGRPHFSKGKYDLELIRGASKLDTTIVGGASKLWKYIIDNNPEVNSIVYYIDRNIYSGSSISTLEGNLKLVSTQVGFWNYFVDTKEMKNRQPKHHKEIKELVEQGKVWEVYNAGTETYVWTR